MSVVPALFFAPQRASTLTNYVSISSLSFTASQRLVTRTVFTSFPLQNPRSILRPRLRLVVTAAADALVTVGVLEILGQTCADKCSTSRLAPVTCPIFRGYRRAGIKGLKGSKTASSGRWRARFDESVVCGRRGRASRVESVVKAD